MSSIGDLQINFRLTFGLVFGLDDLAGLVFGVSAAVKLFMPA